MKNMILAVIFTAAYGGRAHAATNSALGCLQASAQSGGIGGCLNESEKRDTSPLPAGGMPSRTGAAPALAAAFLETTERRRSTVVPTPTGYTPAEEGSLKAGFYNGLDSGFKTVFAGIEYLPVLGMQASGAPYKSNAGTAAFTALGVLLAIPAAIIAAVLGAPLGAAAGMIAEKAAPGSTDDWFTF